MNEIKFFEVVIKELDNPEVKKKKEETLSEILKISPSKEFAERAIKRAERTAIGFLRKYYSDITDEELIKKLARAQFLIEYDRAKTYARKWLEAMASIK